MPLQSIDLSKLEGESLREQIIAPQQLPKEIMRARCLRLALQGMNAKRAAAATGYPYDTVRRIYREPGFQADVRRRVDLTFEDIDVAYQTREKTLHEKIAEKAEDAFATLCEMLEDDRTLPGHKIKIAQDLLNRREDTTPFSARTTNLDADKLRAAALAARDMDAVIPAEREHDAR